MSRLAYLREHRGLVAQWFGVLGPAAAWSAQFLVTYNLADVVSCSPGAIPALAMDDRVKPFLALATALAAAVALAAGFVSYGCWKRLRAADPPTGGRAHWLALAGMFSSALFLLMILAGFLPLAFLSSCSRVP